MQFDPANPKVYLRNVRGGQFQQSFGWYINQAYFRLGIRPRSLDYLEEVCPHNFQSMIQNTKSLQMAYQKESARINQIVYGPRREIAPEDEGYWGNLKKGEANLMRHLAREFARSKTKLNNLIEDSVRQEFGFRKIGEGWVSETLLYQIIARSLKGHKIIRHHRPDWLEGLELDMYIPSLNLGIEYQGQQHFQSIKAWGGNAALIALQERDARKKQLCKSLHITLLEVDYTEPLTDEHINTRLSKAGINRKI